MKNTTGLNPFLMEINTLPTPTPGKTSTLLLTQLQTVWASMFANLACVDILVQGTFTQDGGSGTRVFIDNFIRGLIEAIGIQSTIYGAPMQTATWTGANLGILEFVLNGYTYGEPRRGVFPAADDDYDFSVVVSIPLSAFVGEDGAALTSLPVAGYRKGNMTIQWADPSVIDSISTGSSFKNLTCTVTAGLALTRELRLPSFWEVVNYIAPSTAKANQLATFSDFGQATGLLGTEPGSLIAWSILRGSLNGADGPVDVASIQSLAWPWRDILLNTDLGWFNREARKAACSRPVVGSVADDDDTDGLLWDASGYPNIMGARTGIQNDKSITDGTAEGIVLVNPGCDLRLSNCQRAPFGSQSIQLSIDPNDLPATTNWNLLTIQVKAFDDSIRRALYNLCLSSKALDEVYGTDPKRDLRWQIDTSDGMPGTFARRGLQQYLPRVLKDVSKLPTVKRAT